MNLFLGVNLALWATAFGQLSVKAPNQFLNFSADHFVVHFRPWVAPGDNAHSYQEADLVPMIQLISTKFTKIGGPWLHNFDDKRTEQVLPTAIARFNRDNANTRQPMELFMAVNADTDQQVEPGTNRTLFQHALSIAERANTIHRGTVKYIIMEPWRFRRSNADGVRTQLADVQRQLVSFPGGKNYRLGALFRLETCGSGSKLPAYLALLLIHIEVVQFTKFPTKQEEEYDAGVEETTKNFIRLFERCKERIGKTTLGIEVAFRTEWSDRDFNGKQNYTAQVYFWRRMNDWAVASNTTIFLLEAFDQQVKKNEKAPQDHHRGWWTLTTPQEELDFTEIADYAFEDKWEVALRQEVEDANEANRVLQAQAKAEVQTATTSTERPPSSGRGVGVSHIVLISVIAAVLILGMMMAGMFFLYRRVAQVENRQQSVLTKEEMREFFEGDASKNSKQGPSVDTQEGCRAGRIINSLQLAAYDNKYELPLDSFRIDETSPLGMGTYGVVCRGTLLKRTSSMEVAVKMVKDSSAIPTTALRGLLSEIKVMSYLGQHENLVGLVGAYTKELGKGKVYVFTELCSLGSLEKYLREMEPRNISEEASEGERGPTESCYLMADGTRAFYDHGKEVGQLDSKDLYRWSYQIANGMEFLASKHVVHADLATRNVLLTKDKTAKISDFGLSRRLYDYTNYVKTKQEPLPWRWMAPESLQRLEFNEKTDVWSYGITLWEIYSHGNLPYPGLSWNPDFPMKLKNGLRMEEPEHNADGMYVTMLRCWNVDPTKRPTFSELRGNLRG